MNSNISKEGGDSAKPAMPRAIRDKVDYQNTAEIVDRLAVLDRRTRGQDEYLETLTQLVEAYDNGNFQVAATAGPLDAIRFLMDAHDLSASDIGRILGSRSLGAANGRCREHVTRFARVVLSPFSGRAPRSR